MSSLGTLLLRDTKWRQRDSWDFIAVSIPSSLVKALVTRNMTDSDKKNTLCLPLAFPHAPYMTIFTCSCAYQTYKHPPHTHTQLLF